MNKLREQIRHRLVDVSNVAADLSELADATQKLNNGAGVSTFEAGQLRSRHHILDRAIAEIEHLTSDDDE